MKFALIDNWRQAWRMYSIKALGVIATAQASLALMPAHWLAARVPFMDGFTYADALVTLSIAAAVLGGIGRLIDQGDKVQEP